MMQVIRRKSFPVTGMKMEQIELMMMEMEVLRRPISNQRKRE